MIPPAPRILPECLGGAGNCAASDGLRRRAFSFASVRPSAGANQNGGAGCLRTPPSSLLELPGVVSGAGALFVR